MARWRGRDRDADAARLAKLDRKRPKKGSNREWAHPHDPEITKMKDGRTGLAHKAAIRVLEGALGLKRSPLLKRRVDVFLAGPVGGL